MTLQWLNALGLVLGMAGVIVIFIWGPPQPWFGPALAAYDGPELKKQLAEGDRKRRRYKHLSSFGLVLIGIGFLCQFVSSLPPLQHPKAISDEATYRSGFRSSH